MNLSISWHRICPFYCFFFFNAGTTKVVETTIWIFLSNTLQTQNSVFLETRTILARVPSYCVIKIFIRYETEYFRRLGWFFVKHIHKWKACVSYCITKNFYFFFFNFNISNGNFVLSVVSFTHTIFVCTSWESFQTKRASGPGWRERCWIISTKSNEPGSMMTEYN